MGRPYNTNYNLKYNAEENRAMNITDELREFTPEINGCKLMRPCDEKELLAIADRIDAAHEKALSQAYMDVSDSEWIRLPKDADNVPWKPGDHDEDGNEVTELRLTSDGWFVVVTDGEWSHRPESKRHYHAPTVEDVLCDLLNEYREWSHRPERKRHHHAPTVEDVLCDLLNEYRENECTLEETRLSECASKLRLTEERENA